MPGVFGFTINGGQLYLWDGARPAHRVDLSTGALSVLPRIGVRALDEREIVDTTDNRLEALDLRSGARRILLTLPKGDSILSGRIDLDAECVYFGTHVGPVRGRENSGLFRLRRDGSQAPERLAPEPQQWDRYELEAGFVYWVRQDPAGKHAFILRRALKPDAREEVILDLPRPPTASPWQRFQISEGRLYYIDGDVLWSAPVEGGAPPTKHVKIGDADGILGLLIKPPCVYWIDGELKRARLRGGPTETLARVAASHLDTDGCYLYWVENLYWKSRIMRLGRPGHSTPLRTVRIMPTKSATGAASEPP